MQEILRTILRGKTMIYKRNRKYEYLLAWDFYVKKHNILDLLSIQKWWKLYDWSGSNSNDFAYYASNINITFPWEEYYDWKMYSHSIVKHAPFLLENTDHWENYYNWDVCTGYIVDIPKFFETVKFKWWEYINPKYFYQIRREHPDAYDRIPPSFIVKHKKWFE